MSAGKSTSSKNIAGIAILIFMFVAAIAVIVLAGNRIKLRQMLLSPSRPICNKGDYRVYFKQTHRCYVEGKQGPCGQLMILHGVKRDANQSDLFGECQCQTFGQLGCDTRPTVYWQATKRCYFLFDQGPCRKGRWLVINQFNNPTCVTIPCPSEYNAQSQISRRDSADSDPDPKFVYSSYSKCNLTLTQGFCPDGEIVHFTSTSFRPLCRKATQECLPNYSNSFDFELELNITNLEVYPGE
ncbi:unnamed protein product [Allacma fusca]|uniref:DUF4789 domain-containing protein n=1 Tax=Allacma fusca TaxID=39272 RepID=A0A8J2P2Z0_9HEXA|nr:unnamed protein product [Allacma fusca]